MAGEEARLLAELIIQERAQFPQANMAVLVRARSHLEALVAEIRSRYPDHPSLKFQAVEIEQLSGRQTVQDIHALTSALCHRADRVHWLAILRAPWCGLTLADLHALAADDHHSNIWQLMQDETRVVRLSADGQQRLRHVREVIAEAYAHQGRQSLRRWVESVWLMLGGPQCLWDAGDVRDVQAFLGLLDDMTTLDAALLQTRMEKLFAAPDVQADGYLQFMTIHKSKGLEFDSVILPGLHRSSRNNDAQLLLWDEIPVEGAHSQLVAAPFVPKHKRDDATTGYEYLQGLERERDANESARVLYVAATRTRQRLHLVAAIKQDSEGHIKAPANTLLDLLWDSVEGEFLSAESRDVLPSPLQGEGQDGGGNLLASYPHLQCAPALARTGRSAGDQHADRNPCFTPSPPPEKGREFVPSLIRLPRPTVPILLGAECSMPLPGPPVLPEAREEVASLEASCGTLAHLYMEMFARQGAAQWPIERLQGLLPAMQRWFGRQGHTEQECNDGARRVLQALTTTLASESGQWVLQAHPQAASEWALATVENGQVRQHVIDRTFVADGVRWIVDYKSARLGMASNVAAEAYRPQLERYARLFRDEGLPVRKAVFFLASGKLVEIEE
jgi:ATP-dependent exoDNAse (exonuclease V) beta subunit